MKIDLDAQFLKQLKHINVSNPKRVKGNFPDFLIIGPQRTGTTWLTANLNYHPEIFLTFPKEIYFFDRLNLKNNRFSKHYYDFNWDKLKKHPNALFRELVKILYFDYYKTGFYKANELEWYMKYFSFDVVNLLMKNYHTYKNHKMAFSPKVRGEATASTAILEDEVIKEIISINPNIKAILMVRNPIERAWSHAKKDVVRNAFRKYNEASSDEFIQFFHGANQLKNGRYTEHIDKWRHYLKEGNLFVGFYDHISTQPEKFLKDVFQFLEVSGDERYVSPTARRVINGTAKIDIPEQYKVVLDDIFKEEKAKIAEQYNIHWS